MSADNTYDIVEASSHLSSGPMRHKNNEVHSSDSERALFVEVAKDDTIHGAQGAHHPAMTSTEHSVEEVGMQLPELQCLLIRLQADHLRLVERMESLPQYSHRPMNRYDPYSSSYFPSAPPAPPVPPQGSIHIICQIEPKFWKTFQVVGRMAKQISSVDVLVGDQAYLSTDEALKRRAGSSFTNHATEQKDHLHDALIDTAAMKELDDMRGRYMPEIIRINVFLLQYLLRTILGVKAEISHDPSHSGLLLFNPYRNILRNSDMLIEKLETFVKLIGSYESENRTEDGDQSRDARSGPTIYPNMETGTLSAMKQCQDDINYSGESQDADTAEPVTLTIAAIQGIMEKLDIPCCAECYSNLLEEFNTTKEAKDTVKCFLFFVQEYLIPVHETYRKRVPTQVTFSQLWHVFQPGDHLTTNADPDVDYHNSFDLYSSIWKVLRVQGGRRSICRSNSSSLSGPLPPLPAQCRQPPRLPVPVNGILPFTIDTYVLDYDGLTIVPVRRRFFISPFIGQRKIVDLEVFPSEYASGRLASRDVLIKRGKKFFEYVTSGRTGCHVDVQGTNLRHMQEIFDEQMIIDPTTYWENTTHLNRAIFSQPEYLYNKETKHYCTSDTVDSFCQRNHLFYAVPTVSDEYVDQDSMDSFTRNEHAFEDYSERILKDKPEMTDDDFAICTHQVPGWLLRSRKFGQ